MTENHATDLYSRRFDQYNKHWTFRPLDNRMFLQAIQGWANDRLTARGFLFLNEVQEMLGFDWTARGQIVGWFKAPGSNHVDFNITEVEEEPGCFILSFNPDGVIYHKL